MIRNKFWLTFASNLFSPLQIAQRWVLSITGKNEKPSGLVSTTICKTFMLCLLGKKQILEDPGTELSKAGL